MVHLQLTSFLSQWKHFSKTFEFLAKEFSQLAERNHLSLFAHEKLQSCRIHTTIPLLANYLGHSDGGRNSDQTTSIVVS